MQEPSVLNIYNLLVRSRLLSESDAAAMFQRWRTEAKNANDSSQFTKWMAGQGIVTAYQASLLARGHSEGYFLDQYKILDRLGKGRMAGVFKAVHPSGQMVAIKVLPPSKGKDPQLLARFQREARLSVGLAHRNVVRTFQVGETNGIHYLVMECLEGETFDQVLQRRGKLSPAEAVPIIYQALLGLQHLHEKGVVHRDVKPANLMLLDPATGAEPKDLAHAVVKILDIGLARVLSDEAGVDKPDQPPLTTEEILLGTPDYMAPEQAREARSADIRADIYSLGCVLYHALAGQPPFSDTNIVSQMLRHASEPPRPLAEFNPAVPDGLQQIVNWMMAKDPSQRYPNPARAARALEVFLVARDDLNAGQEPDAKMQSYLSWLEMEVVEPKTPSTGNGDAIDAVAPKNAPDAAPPPVPPPAKPPRPRTESATAAAKSSAKEAELRNPPKPSETPTPRPASEPEAGFDVDLVAVPNVGKAAGKPHDDLRLSRRDFLMFAIGAGTVLLALALGKILAFLFPFKKPASVAPEDSESTTEK